MPKYLLTDGVKNVPLDSLDGGLFTDFVRGESTAKQNPNAVYATVAYLYRCVDVRANSLTAVPWAIYKGENEVISNDADIWPQELAWCANLEDLLWQSEAALCIKAEAFVNKLRNVGKRAVGLQWLDPNTMTPVWTPQGLAGFERTLDKGKKDTLAAEDVIYLRLVGISETAPRVAPVNAALSAAGVLANMDAFVTGYFQRGAIKATILTVEGNPPAAERERLKAWWRRAFSGVGKAFGAEVVSAAVTPVVIGEGLAELTNVDLTASRREDIATALGVPHSLVMSNAANYATAESDRLTFYDTTIIPECNLISRQLNQQLFAPLGYRFEFKPDTMPIYQADENSRATAFAAYVGAGLPRSLVAQMLGLHLPDGVEFAALDPVEIVAPEPMPAQPEAVKTDGKPILGYHIESGVVTRNEARADVGLPPVDDSGDKVLRDLNAKLDVMIKARNAGIAPADAAQLVGLDVQIETVEPTPQTPSPTPQDGQGDAVDMPQESMHDGLQNTEETAQEAGQVGAKSDEARKFLRWAKGKRTPDPAKFVSDILTVEERAELLAGATKAHEHGADCDHAAEIDDIETGEDTDAAPLDVSTRDAYKALLLQHDPGDDSTAEEQLLLDIEESSRREIAAALRKQFKDLLPANAENMSLDELHRYLDGRVSNQAVNDAIDRTVRRASDAGVNIAMDQLETLGVGFDFTAVNTAAREWASRYSAELITNVNDTTKKAVRESVSRWYNNGEPLNALTKDLASTFSPRRAQLIAMTETTRSAAEGARSGYTASGVVTEMIWLTANDEIVCPQCGALNGAIVSIEGSFADALPQELRDKLGDKTFDTPPAHPGCRCRIGAKVVEVDANA